MNPIQKLTKAVNDFLTINKINVKNKTGFTQEVCFISGYLSALENEGKIPEEEFNHLKSFVFLLHSAGRSFSTLGK